MADRSIAPGWNIVGNAAAVERLQRAVRQGPRHAYLLAGPHAIGKTLLARTFAAALLCPESANAGAPPCGVCRTCRRVFRGVHPDVTTFGLESQTAQDEGNSRNLTLNIRTVRAISHHVSLRPVEASWRVVVVDDVETMQETAQEAFLKTLEEPPAYVVILLLTTDAELLLPTILSRCAVVPMVPASETMVKHALVERGADETRADRIATATRGRAGLALRALEDDALFTALTEAVTGAVSWVNGDEYGRMVEAFRLADQFTSARESVFDQLLAAEAAWRELVLAVSGVPSASGHPVLASARLETVADGVRALTAIDCCIRDLDANVRPRAALGAMVQQWPAVAS